MLQTPYEGGILAQTSLQLEIGDQFYFNELANASKEFATVTKKFVIEDWRFSHCEGKKCFKTFYVTISRNTQNTKFIMLEIHWTDPVNITCQRSFFEFAVLRCRANVSCEHSIYVSPCATFATYIANQTHQFAFVDHFAVHDRHG